MESSVCQIPPGGSVVRLRAAGLQAGAPLSRVQGPAQAFALVSSEVQQAEALLQSLLTSQVAALSQIAGYLVTTGGKRLRPVLAALGARVVGYTKALPELLCVGELVHLGSLLHDDVVDQGVLRRGHPTAHRVYGNAASILAGDFCLGRAVALACSCAGHPAVTQLSQAIAEMAEGEVMQLQRVGDVSCTLDTYLSLVDKKSAALIGWCVSAAALAAGRPDDARVLSAYGRAIGVAFQITDDVLDYSQNTGKQPGTDLRERKVTLPLLYAMEADPALRHLLSQGRPNKRDVLGLMQRVRNTGSLERSLDYARALVQPASANLDALPPGPALQALRSVGRYLVERSA